jgi:hypothetical protein
MPDTEEVTGSNPVRPTRHFLFLALQGSALWPYNWPYGEGERHAQVTGTRSSPRARTSAHMASSAHVGALHAPGSALWPYSEGGRMPGSRKPLDARGSSPRAGAAAYLRRRRARKRFCCPVVTFKLEISPGAVCLLGRDPLPQPSPVVRGCVGVGAADRPVEQRLRAGRRRRSPRWDVRRDGQYRRPAAVGVEQPVDQVQVTRPAAGRVYRQFPGQRGFRGRREPGGVCHRNRRPSDLPRARP